MAKYKIIPSSRTIVQSPISIGHKAEKGVEAIEFDLTAWVETYGSGTLTVIMRRWGDAIPYPIALEIDENNKATWTLSDTDTAKAGMAYAQLNYIVGDEVVKKSDIYTFRVMDSLTGEGEPPEAYESWLEQLTHLAAEAMAEVLDIEDIVTDKTLSIDGGIADAKTVGDELGAINESLDTFSEDLAEYRQGGGGLTDEARYNILACLENVAWIDDDGQDYLDALESALFPVAKLVGITAVYTQSGIVYPDASLESLKDNLVVTAHYDNSSTQILHKNFYSLSGTLTGGTSVITVSHANKTATFNVTVTPLAYAFENGEFTFTTYPHSFSVSNGNRVSVDMKAGVKYALYGNVSKLSNNTTVSSANENFLNNGETYFILHSGKTLSTKVTINSVYSDRLETGAEVVAAFRPRTGNNIRMIDSNGSNVKVNTLYAGQIFEQTYTAESDIDILCCIVYIGTRSKTDKELLIDYTVEAKIDGVRVI